MVPPGKGYSNQARPRSSGNAAAWALVLLEQAKLLFPHLGGVR